MNKIKLILADDHPLIREGFKSLLKKSENIDIVGEAEDGRELLKLINTTFADIILIDITMPYISGLDVISQVKETNDDLKFIILSMHEEREYILKAIKAGVDGYLLKNIEKDELTKAISSVYEGKKYFSSSISNILAENILKSNEPEKFEITSREKEVLQYVAKGLSTKQIADKLTISDRTVETHRINLLKKLKVANTAELIRKAFENKLIN